MSITVDSAKLYEISDALMNGTVKYFLGSKANLNSEPTTIKTIDCSGFTQYAIYKAANKAVIFHGGSVMQREFCEQNLKLEKVDYATCAATDGWLRIAFLKKKGHIAGHVWMIHNGLTLESYDGGTAHGPGRRAWDIARLKDNVYVCYKLSQLFV